MKTLTEIVGLAVVALVLGLGWNSFSDSGINVEKKLVHDVPTGSGSGPTNGDGTQGPETTDVTEVAKRSYDDPKSWNEDGVQFCNIDKAVEFYDFDDEAFFLDARKKDEYVEGHIPTGFLCDNYRADQYMPDIKESLLERPFIVVYCGGGDCEDSIYLATSLVEEYDFDGELIYVFKGGMEQWTEHGLPVHAGEDRGEHRPRDK